MINGVQANLGVTRISCYHNRLYFVNLPFFSLLSSLFLLQFAIHQYPHASACFNSVQGSAALKVEMLHIWPLLMCRFQIPRFHPGCSAWVGWNPLLSIWDNPISAILETAAEVPILYLLPHWPVVGSGWIPLDKEPNPTSQQWHVQE